MSTPEQMIEAQRIALEWWSLPPEMLHKQAPFSHLITPDALAALLRERDQLADEVVKANGLLDMQMKERAMLQQQRDQWRECAEALRAALENPVERYVAARSFDALKAKGAA